MSVLNAVLKCATWIWIGTILFLGQISDYLPASIARPSAALAQNPHFVPALLVVGGIIVVFGVGLGKRTDPYVFMGAWILGIVLLDVYRALTDDTALLLGGAGGVVLWIIAFGSVASLPRRLWRTLKASRTAGGGSGALGTSRRERQGSKEPGKAKAIRVIAALGICSIALAVLIFRWVGEPEGLLVLVVGLFGVVGGFCVFLSVIALLPKDLTITDPQKMLLLGLGILGFLVFVNYDNKSTATEKAAQSTAPTLQQAIAAGLVQASFSGTGASSGRSVTVQLSRGPNAARRHYWIALSPGSRLESSDPNAQSMMILGAGWENYGSGVRQKTTLKVPASGTATYPLDAYCVDFEKDNPSAHTSFSLRAPDPKLECIARRSTAAELSISAAQAAVWMYTDHLTYEEINSKFRTSTTDWNVADQIVAACGIMPH